MNNMDWDRWRYFLAVARAGTVSAAARQLGISHATVLRRLEQFERDLGVALFKRLQSGYRLTETGEKLLPDAEALELKAQALIRHLRSEAPVQTLRVSQPENAVLNLFPLYRAFMLRHPGIRLELHSSVAVSDLNRLEADVAIRFTREPPELLVGRCIGKTSYGAFASRDYLARFPTPPSMEQCDWIVWERDDAGVERDRQQKWLAGRVENPQVVMLTSSSADVLDAIRAGIGVGMVSLSIAAQYPDILALPFPTLSSELKLWLLTHRDMRRQPAILTFMRFMADALQGPMEGGAPYLVSR